MAISSRWVCPACARRVPGAIEICRCGAARLLLSAPAGTFETRIASCWKAATPRVPLGIGQWFAWALSVVAAFVIGAELFRGASGPTVNASPTNTAVVRNKVERIADVSGGTAQKYLNEFRALEPDERAPQARRSHSIQADTTPVSNRQSPSAIDMSRPLQSVRSSMDVQREDAAAAFGPRFETLRVVREETIGDNRRYIAACRGKVTKARPRATAGIPLDRTLIGSGAIVSLGKLPPQGFVPEVLEIQNQTTAPCLILWHDITAQSVQVQDELSRIDDEARHRGIYPGIIRDLRAQYGFGLENIPDFLAVQ